MAGEWDYDLTPREVAELKGVSVQAVTAACRAGRLKARKAGGSWLIRRVDAEAWQPRQRSQPPQDR